MANIKLKSPKSSHTFDKKVRDYKVGILNMLGQIWLIQVFELFRLNLTKHLVKIKRPLFSLIFITKLKKIWVNFHKLALNLNEVKLP